MNKIENRYRHIAFSSDLFMDGTDHFTENSFCLVKDILFINFTRLVGLSPPVSIIDWLKSEGIIPPLLDIVGFTNLDVKDHILFGR